MFYKKAVKAARSNQHAEKLPRLVHFQMRASRKPAGGRFLARESLRDEPERAARTASPPRRGKCNKKSRTFRPAFYWCSLRVHIRTDLSQLVLRRRRAVLFGYAHFRWWKGVQGVSPWHTTLLARYSVLYLPATGVRKRGTQGGAKRPLRLNERWIVRHTLPCRRNN